MIAASAGNHAQAVAYHAKRLGIPATIVMPRADADGEGHPDRRATAPTSCSTATCSTTPTPRRASWRSRRAMSSSTRSTIRRSSPARARSALEMLEDAPDLDTIVVPIGGGGLMSGMSIAARAVKPDIELIGVEAELYPSMKCAIEGCHMPLGGDTLAEGIAVKQPGELTSRILAELRRRRRAGLRARPRARGRDAGRDRKDGGRRRRRRRPRRDARRPRALQRQEGRDRAVRRQHRHASARQCAGPRPRPRRAGSRGSTSPRTTSPARSPRSPPRSTKPASTSSRSTTAASSPACRPRTR